MEVKLHYHVCGKMSKTVKVGSHFDNSQVMKSHPKGDNYVKFSVDWSHKWIVAIKTKLPNSVSSQINIHIAEIE